MSETAQAAAIEQTATETPAQTAPAPAQQEPEDEEKRYPWLNSRLGRERKSLVKQLGAESIDEAKALIEEARKLKTERMSELERLQQRVAELEPMAKERDELRSSVEVQAREAMAALTAEQREVVEELAGESPTKQLKAIAKLKPTWKAQAAAPLPPPASTSAGASAPAPTAAQSENHLATWERLRSSHPIAAAYYLDQHQVEITEARKARK